MTTARFKILFVALAMAVPACQSGQTAAPSVAAPANQGPASVVAIVDGRSIRAGDLAPLLAEAAGGTVLGEWVLDMKLVEAMGRAGVRLTKADLDRERALLAGQLAEDPDTAERLLERLRADRGLGPRRFAMLLRRNAALRKLVVSRVVVNEPMVRQFYEQQYGAKAVVRMILVRDLNAVGPVKRRLDAGESFSDVAVAMSIDISRNQGGLLPPISAQDDSFPKGVRDAATRLVPGQVSQPVAVEGGFAILRCERKIEAEEVPYDQVAGRLRRQLNLRMARTLMEQRARALLQEAGVTVMDGSMARSWQQHRRRIGRKTPYEMNPA